MLVCCKSVIESLTIYEVLLALYFDRQRKFIQSRCFTPFMDLHKVE